MWGPRVCHVSKELFGPKRQSDHAFNSRGGHMHIVIGLILARLGRSDNSSTMDDNRQGSCSRDCWCVWGLHRCPMEVLHGISSVLLCNVRLLPSMMICSWLLFE
ncbi:hypothetical protein ACOSQ3_023666 [Xanthoceras sorbifolium]